MNTEKNIEKMTRSYRITVIAMTFIIVFLFSSALCLVWFGLPGLLTGIVHDEVRTAFDESLETNP